MNKEGVCAYYAYHMITVWPFLRNAKRKTLKSVFTAYQLSYQLIDAFHSQDTDKLNIKIDLKL